jgi:hypothetical protein
MLLLAHSSFIRITFTGTIGLQSTLTRAPASVCIPLDLEITSDTQDRSNRGSHTPVQLAFATCSPIKVLTSALLRTFATKKPSRLCACGKNLRVLAMEGWKRCSRNLVYLQRKVTKLSLCFLLLQLRANPQFCSFCISFVRNDQGNPRDILSILETEIKDVGRYANMRTSMVDLEEHQLPKWHTEG